jgi:hypothetical protein
VTWPKNLLSMMPSPSTDRKRNSKKPAQHIAWRLNLEQIDRRSSIQRCTMYVVAMALQASRVPCRLVDS